LILFATSVLGQTITLAPSGTRGYSTRGVYIDVTMVNQEPDPVEPGSYFDVRFKVENKGQENAEDVQLEIIPEYPFTLKTGEEAIKEVGSVHGRQTGDIGAIVKYQLKVDENALEGEYGIKLRYKYGSYDWVELDEFTLNVRPETAILSIASVKSTPEQIKPGDKAILTFLLENMENIGLKDIKVKLDLTDLSLAPIGSSTEKIIYKINPNKRAEVDFTLIADADAESGLNKVPVSINYRDKLNNNYSINSDIGLIIGARPEMTVNIDEAEIKQSGQTGEVTIKFVNKGISDIKFLEVKLAKTDDFKLLSPDTVYIGNIDSDDYETADFDIKVEETDKNEIILPLTVEYKDANNQDIKENIDLNLILYSQEEVKELGLAKGNGTVGIIVVIVIIVAGLAGFIFWRKRKRK